MTLHVPLHHLGHPVGGGEHFVRTIGELTYLGELTQDSKQRRLTYKALRVQLAHKCGKLPYGTAASHVTRSGE